MSKKIKFVRFGDLNQKKIDKGKKKSKNITYHTPPQDFGIYAFPEHLIEPFLVTWKYDEDEKGSPYRHVVKRKIKNLNIEDDKDYDKYVSITSSTMWMEYKVINYTGNVWHHLMDFSKSSIRTEFWVLDTYEEYCKILNKALHKYKKAQMRYDWYKGSFDMIPKTFVKKYISKDEYEVYLTDKIK